VILTDDDIAKMQTDFPTMPHELRANWQSMKLDESVINAVLARRVAANLLNEILSASDTETTKRIFNWFASVPDEEFNLDAVESGLVGPRRLIELSEMVGANQLSSTGAKEIFLDLFDEKFRGKLPEEIAREKKLLQNSNEDEISKIVDEVLVAPDCAKAVADFRAGNEKVIGFLVGQVMKASKGQANPALAQKLIREKLKP
jgi:aspartyl-tRNA(Asn)/glutamyl-tRNA(Gln) amidotransferase subunit B